jgi:colanic acid/amylovoran biosynthesis glycosyltransferase
MKIAYILEKFPSPTEYFILNEILQFEKNGYEIFLLVLKRQKQYENLPELKELKATIHYLPRFHFYFPIIPFIFAAFSLFWTSLYGSLSPVSRLRSPASRPLSPVSHLLNTLRYWGISQYFAKKNIQCDHIHAHFAFIAVDIARHLSTLLKVNYSLTAHAQDIYTNQQKIIQHLPTAKFLITCTEYNKNYLNKLTDNIFEGKIHRVYHGIHLEKWPQISNCNKSNNNGLKILTIARLVEKKGLIYLIKAVERLVGRGARVQCVIVGGGSLHSVLKNYINTKKLHNNIELIPFISQNKLKAFYFWADTFVLPCIISSNGDRDGLPNVILEAMLSGVPVISTPVSAITEVIYHKETGVIVKEKDDRAIVEGIGLLTGDHNLQQYIIKNSRRLIEEKLNLNSSTKELLEIFSSHIPFSQYKAQPQFQQ